MIWDKMTFLRALFSQKREAADTALRWQRARRAEPRLAVDLIRLGGVLTAQPSNGQGDVAELDPLRLAYEAGRRDLALHLLAMADLTMFEMNSLMENNDAP